MENYEEFIKKLEKNGVETVTQKLHQGEYNREKKAIAEDWLQREKEKPEKERQERQEKRDVIALALSYDANVNARRANNISRCAIVAAVSLPFIIMLIEWLAKR